MYIWGYRNSLGGEIGLDESGWTLEGWWNQVISKGNAKSLVKMNLLWRIEEGKKEQEHFAAVKSGHCGTPHTGMCELKTSAGFRCGKLGHQVRDRPK